MATKKFAKSAKSVRRSPPGSDRVRERRILDEILVDAYGPEEQAMGWYYHLDGKLRFPFPARCRAARAISPLQPADRVTVIATAPEEEREREMLATIAWQERSLAVPLAQLEVRGLRSVDGETREAVADWHYWFDQGYCFRSAAMPKVEARADGNGQPA